eukprot:2257921-Prymnesium_polylepis.1
MRTPGSRRFPHTRRTPPLTWRAHTSQRGGAIAAANYNGTYEVLKVDEGSSVLSCAFSPDKRTIACGTAAGGLTLRGIRSCATQDIVGMTCPPNSMCVDATVLPGSMRLVAVGVWWSDG